MTVNFAGHVYDDAGNAVSGASVKLLETGTTTQEGSTVTTDSDGAWAFTEADQDRYDVEITKGTSVRRIRWDDQISLKEIDVRTNTGATTPALTLTNITNATANLIGKFGGANTTRADNDEIYFTFELANSAGELTEFGRMTIVATDVTNGSEDGQIEFDVMKAGTLTKVWTITSSTGASMSFDMNVDALTIGSGADTDVSLTFDANSADGVITWMEDEDYFEFSDDILMNGTEKISFNDTGEYISGDGTDLTIGSGADINLTATTDINVPANVGITFGNDAEKIEGDGTDLTISGNNINLTAVADVVIPANVGITFGSGEKIEGDSTDLTVTSGADINLTATGDVNMPANVGITFGDDAEKIEGDGTDLTISGNNINLTAAADVVIPANIGLTFGSGEKIEGDSTDLTITSGAKINLTATSDVVIPADVGITFGTGEKIEGDNTDLTVTSGAKINLTATSDVHIPKNVGIVFDDNASEKIESNNTDLTLNSGADINLTATTDINVPANVGITFGDDAEKIEGDGTDLTITGNNINLTATADVVIPANVGITFGSGEKIEGDSTDLTITSGADIALTATSDVNIPANVGLTFGNDGEKIEGDGTDLTITANSVKLAGDARNKTIFIPTSDVVTTGSRAAMTGTQWIASKLDAGATEVAYCQWAVPDDFGSFTAIEYVYIVEGGTTGTVRFNPVVAYGAFGEAWNGATEAATDFTSTDPSATNNIRVEDAGFSLSALAVGDFIACNIERIGAHAADTYTADINVIGVNFKYVRAKL